jgi:DNA-binding response OmpR family regulator
MPLKLLIAMEEQVLADVIAFDARMTWPDCAVTRVPDVAHAMRCFQDEPADLVILGVTLPVDDGLPVCQQIRATSQAPIMILSAHDSVLDKVRALDLGADDYLSMPFDHLELLARLRALVRRSAAREQLAHAAPDNQIFHLDAASHAVHVQGRAIRLTGTEYRLLDELVRHAGMVLTHQVLVDRVWGPEYGGAAHYLKVFVRRLRQKLGDDSMNARYIQTEWGIGYRFVALS